MIVIVLFSPVVEGLNIKSLPVSQIIFTDNVLWSAWKIKVYRNFGIFTDDGDGDNVDDEVGHTIDLHELRQTTCST